MKRWVLAAVAAAGLAWPAMAAEPANRGIEVSPPFNNIVVTGGQVTPFTIGLRNRSDVAQTLSVTAVDFKALDETGGAAFINTSGQTDKYTLAKWMELDQDSVTIKPGESVKLTGRIINRDDLSPGGHYGAVLFGLDPSGAGGGNQVALKQVASSLLFVIKTGGEKYGLDLKSVNAPKSAFSPPSKLRLRFYNGGNVHTAPRGIVTISDPSGRIVSKGTVNVDSSLVLPDSYRQIPVTMQHINLANAIGNYEVLVQYRDGNQDQIKTFSQKIYIFSLLGALQGLFWLAILGIGLRAFYVLNRR